MKIINHEEQFHIERARLEEQISQNESVRKAGVGMIMELYDEWYNEFLKEWDEVLQRCVIAAIKKGHTNKMKLELGVFNFSNENIPDEAKEILKIGKKSVPPVEKSAVAAMKTFESELKNYLKTYRSKVERKPNLETGEEMNIREWLEKATEDVETETNEHKEFYKGLLQNLDQAYKNVEREAHSLGKNMTSCHLHNMLSIKDHVWNEADKNLGFILLPCKKMIEAEQEMKQKLGAEMENKNSSEIIKAVEKEILNFESKLDSNKIQVLENFMHTRRVPSEEVKIPFLKLNGKVQKLSQEEISNKNCTKLSFRPVQDSVSWCLNNYSFILMLFLRELNKEIHEKYPELEEITVLNGGEFSNKMKEVIKGENCEYTALISADMDNAYTNISLEDLESAVKNLCDELECESWKADLIIQLSKLVLQNNYVEASIGIMKIGPNLPMGNCASGEALDTVSIAYELKKKVAKHSRTSPKANIPSKVQAKITEDGNSELSEKLGSVKMLKRYRDDIYGIAASQSIGQIVQDIFEIGTMYPEHIKLTVELGHFYQSFLDVAHYRNLQNGKMTTFVRRNFKVPPLFVPKLSSVPENYKWSALKCELLRHRRICSEVKLVDLNDACLVEEYEKLGYNKHEILKVKKKTMEGYTERYNDNFELKAQRNVPETVLYGSKTVYEGFHNTHVILRELIKAGNPEILKLPIIVPGIKLKSYLFTKRRYLTKQRKFLSNQN